MTNRWAKLVFAALACAPLCACGEKAEQHMDRAGEHLKEAGGEIKEGVKEGVRDVKKKIDEADGDKTD